MAINHFKVLKISVFSYFKKLRISITLDNIVRRIYITGVKVVRQLIKMKGEGRVLAERSEA